MTDHGSNQSKTAKPIDPRSDNPSLNSELHAATENQSSVKPEDYPEEKREMQVRESVPKDARKGKSGKGES